MRGTLVYHYSVTPRLPRPMTRSDDNERPYLMTMNNPTLMMMTSPVTLRNSKNIGELHYTTIIGSLKDQWRTCMVVYLFMVSSITCTIVPLTLF